MLAIIIQYAIMYTCLTNSEGLKMRHIKLNGNFFATEVESKKTIVVYNYDYFAPLAIVDTEKEVIYFKGISSEDLGIDVFCELERVFDIGYYHVTDVVSREFNAMIKEI